MERLSNGQFKEKTGLYYKPHYHALCQKLCDMKRRCTSEKDPEYPNYGGRGIKVCEEWCGADGHKNFYLWAMENGYQKGMSVDRIDNNGDYSPRKLSVGEHEGAREQSKNLSLYYHRETNKDGNGMGGIVRNFSRYRAWSL